MFYYSGWKPLLFSHILHYLTIYNIILVYICHVNNIFYLILMLGKLVRVLELSLCWGKPSSCKTLVHVLLPRESWCYCLIGCVMCLYYKLFVDWVLIWMKVESLQFRRKPYNFLNFMVTYCDFDEVIVIVILNKVNYMKTTFCSRMSLKCDELHYEEWKKLKV